MKIKISEFENQINGAILSRGLDYYKKGYVSDVDETGEGEYEIMVEGSELYTVNLSIRGDVVSDYECDCPYDGSICKHTVAALYYLKNDILASVGTTKKKPKEKSATQQMDKLLEDLSHEDLKIFIRNACANDSKFKQLFVAKHIHVLSPVSKELYTKQAQALIKTYSGRHGFVDYSEAKRLARAVGEMIEEAKASLDKGQYRIAMFIALAVAEEMVQVLNYADDSNGELGGCIEDAFEVLEKLTEKELDEALRDELFGHFLRLFEKDVFKSWEWHFDTLWLAIDILKTPPERARIKTILDKIKPNGKNWDWDYEQAQNLMLALIQKTGDESSATLYMEQNLSNPDFRTQLIEAALDAKDYYKATMMAEEGVAKDEKESPGLASKWRNYLLIIARETKDRENTIRLARYFFVHSGGQFHPSRYYYDILKELIPKEQWADYLENLIIGIKGKDTWDNYSRISQLFIWEEYWDRLLELLRQHVSFERIAEAEPYLSGSYSNELATLYKERILIYMKNNMGRSYYQTACHYIGRMKKLGAKAMADSLVLELKSKYSNRRALMEELGKV
ncbi:SWIM zinc finger domain-containing protein [Dysgonomonas sp. 521]|uniref:SWIM zinc finger family protein n=1 Tax=Dysgonomonas sp. 521 TaxID=2302932 RepID=UPI0013D54514|nr:SWIM zinc finger family protein [Dysgonomonas sp. 521]